MFFISFFLILISSYLFTSVLLKRTDNKFSSEILYFLLTSYAQIILSFELLSLINGINKNNFIICNIIFTVISLILFKLKKSSLYRPNLDIKKILSILKQDKILLILSICFVIFLILQIITAVYSPVNFGDALDYYFPRVTTWLQNGNINHFITPDSRELIMPVNNEFLYSWLFMFTKNEFLAGMFSLLGYSISVFSLYGLLKELNFTTKRSIWSIIVFSGMALVIIEMYTPSSDLLTGALILSGIYFFLKFCKHENKIDLYFSSLSYAIAVGVKTTSIIAVPATSIIFITILVQYNKNNFKKYSLLFIGYFILNFLIFSSYNYILNFIQFHNPVSNSEQYLLNSFRGGIKSWFCSVIKYIFIIFDTSGTKDVISFNKLVFICEYMFLKLFNLDLKSYTSDYFFSYFLFNSKIKITESALGSLGLLAFLPSLIKGFNKKNSKRECILFAFSLALSVNIIILARVMVYTPYNIRYLFTFFVISMPILIYSYTLKKKSIYKIILFILMLNYLIYIPIKNIIYICNTKIQKNEEQQIYDYFMVKKPVNIALIAEQANSPIYYIEKLKLNNFYIDKLLIENIYSYNLTKYQYIITNKFSVTSTNIVNNNSALCTYYDYMQNIINPTENIKPAMIRCEIPFNYFYTQGFTIINSKYKNYIILKNILN